MPSPEQIDAFAKIGALGFALIAIFAMYTRRIRTGGEAQEDAAQADARLTEMRADRDSWRSIAEAYGEKLDNVTRALEIIVAFGAKLDQLLAGHEKLGRAVDKVRELIERGFAKVAGP